MKINLRGYWNILVKQAVTNNSTYFTNLRKKESLVGVPLGCNAEQNGVSVDNFNQILSVLDLNYLHLMDILHLLKYLWKRKWIILVPTIVAVVAAWYFSRNTSQKYTSEAQISTGYIGANPLGNSGFSPNNTVLFNNVIQTLKSRLILDQVSYSLLLQYLQGKSKFKPNVDKAALREMLSAYPGGKDELVVDLKGRAASFHVLNLYDKKDRIIRQIADLFGYSSDNLISVTDINRIEGSDFLRINSTTNNPWLSAFIANEICSSFLTYYQSRRGQYSMLSLDTLRKLVRIKKEVLDNKLKLLPAGGTIAGSNADILINLQNQLSTQKANLITAQATLDEINKNIAETGGNSGLSTNEEIITLRRNIDNLWSKYVNEGSNDAALLNKINTLRSQLQKELSIVHNTGGQSSLFDLNKRKMDLEIKVSAAKQTIGELTNQIALLKNGIQNNTETGRTVQALQNEIEVARDEFSSANKLYNEALNKNMFPDNKFKQVLIASPSLYPDPSKKLQVMGLSGAGIFFLMVFSLLFLELTDVSIKTPSYLRSNISLPVLIALERINLKKYSVGDLFDDEGSFSKTHQSFREKVKQLRYTVNNSGYKVFLISSYHTQAGKTTLINALAESLRLINKKSLLIDADFKNNSLTCQYEATPSLTGIDVCGQDPHLRQIIEKASVKSEDGQISVIGCDQGSHTPDEVLKANNIFTVLKESNLDFDYIFIDTTSISEGPGYKELLEYADASIIVFSADQPLTQEENEFFNQIRDEHMPILGAVLNKVDTYNLE